MIRVTLDVNVLVSGFPAVAGTPSELLDRWGNLEFELVLSEHILEGVSRAWRKPYYQRRYSAEQIQEALSLLRSEAAIVVPAASIQGIGEDEEDDLVLGTAISGNVDVLVTGDRTLRAVGQIQNVEVLTPREFLDLLETSEKEES